MCDLEWGNSKEKVGLFDENENVSEYDLDFDIKKEENSLFSSQTEESSPNSNEGMNMRPLIQMRHYET